MNSSRIRNTYDLSGVIQGVGFRPAVLRLATTLGLAGWIQNRTDSVRVTLEGTHEDIELFMSEISGKLPPNADLKVVTLVESIVICDNDKLDKFSIIPSFASETHALLIPADLAICRECRSEIMDPSNRRYGYAFTTCVNCGPRYTVINSTPYDRERTTLSTFPMCSECRKEYEDQSNRRFHAESIACPICGPRLYMHDQSGKAINDNVIAQARHELAAGRILAIRGIGGFLFAADALNRTALTTLRHRKARPHKPCAVMASNIDVLKKHCIVTPQAEELLLSPKAPIVILDVKSEAVTRHILPIDLITPDAFTIGAMLPNSPLHELLFNPLATDRTPAFELLIMTSGNRGGEPTCITNSEARERLGLIADLILTHDREINLRNDDSLAVIRMNGPQLLRRARGYAPNPVPLAYPLARTVLALGADMKNAIAVAYDKYAVLSPHIGDLETPESVDSLENTARSLPAFLKKTVDAVAVDSHPDMYSTRTGKKIAAELNVIVTEVQHHHAHAAACLAENSQQDGLALVFDGTGLGPDGTIWGAELLDVGKNGFRRLATFAGVPLPGGDAAVRQPARQLAGRFLSCGTEITDEWITRLCITLEDALLWQKQCLEKINAPVTHAAGRLFDSFSVLLGLSPEKITYEGQPAIRLEAAARRFNGNQCPLIPYSTFEKDNKLFIDWNTAFAMLADSRTFKGMEDAWAMAVHRAVVNAAVNMVEYGMNHTSMRTIALSGGVFMNGIFNELLYPRLEALGMNVLIHRKTPPNDGCICLGQAVIAGMK